MVRTSMLRVEPVSWGGDSSALVHGNSTESEARHLAASLLGILPEDLVVGPVERWRKVPAQWANFHLYRVTEGRSLNGSFQARLVT